MTSDFLHNPEIDPSRMAEINQLTVDRRNMFYWQVDRPVSMQEMKTIFMDRHTATDAGEVMSQVQDILADTKDYAGARVVGLSGDAGFKAGSVNFNRLIELDDGRCIVAKVHPTGLANGYFDVEAAAQNAARAVIPTPTIIAVSHKAASGGFDMVLLDQLSGRNAHVYALEHPAATKQLAESVGEQMALLHQVKVKGYGFFDNEHVAQTGELKGIHDKFSSHVLAAMDDNLGVLVGASYITAGQADAMKRLLVTSDSIETRDPRLLHNDMALWNVLTDGSAITGVLDWDECYGGDPYAEIAGWSLFYSADVFERFLSGYQKVAKLGPDFEQKLHIYRLRYIISKVGLRHRKLDIQKDDIMPILIKAGMEALNAELKYFKL